MDLNRRTWRPLRRHHSRMLGGVRRPRPANYLAILCRVVNELLKIDKRMRPYIEEQIRLAEHQKWMDSWEPALRAVYGPPKTPSAPPPVQPPTRRQIAQLIKDEKALLRTQLIIAELEAILSPRGRWPGARGEEPEIRRKKEEDKSGRLAESSAACPPLHASVFCRHRHDDVSPPAINTLRRE